MKSHHLNRLLQEWLQKDTTPADFYELLSFRCFHPNGEDLLEAAMVANRYLHGFQNHRDDDVVVRARHLQRLVAEASATFSDPQKREAYDANLRNLLLQYAEVAGEDVLKWRLSEVRRWLECVRRVHTDRLDDLSEYVRASKPIKLGNTPTRQTTSFRSAAFPFVEKETSASALSRQASPYPLAGSTTPAAGLSKKDRIRLAENGVSSPGADRTSTLPAKSPSADGVRPIPDDTRHDAGARKPNLTRINSTSGVRDPSHVFDGESLLWIIGSAIVSALVFSTIFSLLLLT